jgi:hypothetical protein
VIVGNILEHVLWKHPELHRSIVWERKSEAMTSAKSFPPAGTLGIVRSSRNHLLRVLLSGVDHTNEPCHDEALERHHSRDEVRIEQLGVVGVDPGVDSSEIVLRDDSAESVTALIQKAEMSIRLP